MENQKHEYGVIKMCGWGDHHRYLGRIYFKINGLKYAAAGTLAKIRINVARISGH